MFSLALGGEMVAVSDGLHLKSTQGGSDLGFAVPMGMLTFVVEMVPRLTAVGGLLVGG